MGEDASIIVFVMLLHLFLSPPLPHLLALARLLETIDLPWSSPTVDPTTSDLEAQAFDSSDDIESTETMVICGMGNGKLSMSKRKGLKLKWSRKSML